MYPPTFATLKLSALPNAPQDISFVGDRFNMHAV